MGCRNGWVFLCFSIPFQQKFNWLSTSDRKFCARLAKLIRASVPSYSISLGRQANQLIGT